MFAFLGEDNGREYSKSENTLGQPYILCEEDKFQEFQGLLNLKF